MYGPPSAVVCTQARHLYDILIVEDQEIGASLHSSIGAVLLTLFLPTAWSVTFGSLSLRFVGTQRATQWFAWRRRMRMLTIVFIPAWLSLLSALRLTSQGHYGFLFSLDSIFTVLPFAVAEAITQFIIYRFDGMVLGRQWTVSDLFRLSFWSTLSFAVPLLTLAISAQAVAHHRLVGIPWIICSGIISFVATVRLRFAEGIKPRTVKSGDLYKRTMAISKKMGVRHLPRVSVVPFGKGRLTNAFSGWNGIAISDDYGHWLHGVELDFVIGHELAHVQKRHRLKNLLVVIGAVATVLAVAFAWAPQTLLSTMLLSFAAVLFPCLAFYFGSRRFEFAADRVSVEAIGQGEMATQSLLNMCRRTGAPVKLSFLEEIFSTHPSVQNRVDRLAISRFPLSARE